MAKMEAKAELERQAADLGKEIYRIQTADLPDAMTMAGNLTYFVLSNGAEIEVKPYIDAGIPRKDDDEPAAIERRAGALGWLGDHHPDILKHTVSLGFTKGEDKKVNQLLAMLKKSGYDNVVDETTVHHATLKAFIKEQLTKPGGGVKIPLDLFAVDAGEKATVKLPKPKGTK